MFKSARVKLTLFYLAAILLVSVASTLGYRLVAESVFDNSSSAQQGGIRNLVRRDVGLPLPSGDLDNIRDKQLASVNHELDAYVVYINLVALIIGGFASYWFAGRALKPIEEAHETQSRFASDASHELRTPLTTMHTENEVLLRQKSFTLSEAKTQIESNLEEIQRLEILVSNLLALTKYETEGKIKLSKIKAEDVIDKVSNLIIKERPDSLKRIEIKLSNGIILGNLESLSQVLMIFIDNALKYSPKSSKVRLIGRSSTDVYKFIVEDEGPGIDPKDMPFIFERLFRSDKNRSKIVPGHGLGLSLAMEIAKANEAGLSVSNIKTGGASFTLSVELVK